ncbi:MAG: hydroxymethylbilane synthase [Lachnospiraceae bacterium]|nr:hydroxymethylbilane synthase [Lachnospiraceae bacterium]
MKQEIVIGSRESRLALVQTEIVKKYIEDAHPELSVRVLPMKTEGDRILDQSLETIGGKGLFVKELDLALTEGRSDLSVHSLKDVPMVVPDSLPLVAFSVREDPRDVLVLPEGCDAIDLSKPIGCSSKRRMIQFARMYPEAQFAPIRGNVQTRLRKLDEGQYGATILAAAGLIRLGLTGRISRYFSTEEMIPAAGQGILALQGRAGEDYSFLDGYANREAAQCALAERAFVRALGGDCTTPVAAFGTIGGDTLTLRAIYLDEETKCLHEGILEGNADEPEQIGTDLAERFLSE